jgi:hypothetical protein
MHWVIQSNIFEEKGHALLLETLDRFGLSYSLHKVIPFVGALEPELDLPAGSSAIVMGTYGMSIRSKERGWVPGSFLDNLDFEVQVAKWGDRMLNADAKIYRFDEVPFQEQPFFLRPVKDTKTYTGFVADWGQYQERLAGVYRLAAGGSDIETTESERKLKRWHLAELSMVCTKKQIYNETRTWVIDGEVVTASGYKIGTIPRYTSPAQVDPEVICFARETAQIWSPNRAYVLDVALTPEGYKVVEVNNLNSAGWYLCDMQKLVQSLESMRF